MKRQLRTLAFVALTLSLLAAQVVGKSSSD
ncbi:MAG: hypothetical protein QOE96_3053, partial [Blastocatellia bacterium]|nr:hypothetical protein [Blastocatellia bacterium]